ncbi:2-methylpropanoate--CoA ligase ccl4 [Orobanche hederae]
MDGLKPSSPNSSPLTPLGFLERAATVYSDCTSIIYNSTTYTWSENYRRCLKLASSISSLGIKRRDVVSVVAPNIPAMYELHFAIPMAGAVLNTVNLRLDARTISVILRHSQSRLVFVDYQSESLVLEAVSFFPSKSDRPLLVLIADEGELGISSSRKDAFHADYYEDMILNGDPNFDWIRPESEFDPLTLNYTSGTTSAPKGAVHSHRGTFLVALDSLIEWSVPKEPVYLWTLPMFHANGWSYTWGMAAAGGTNVCLRRFDSASIYAAIRKHNVTHMCGAPVVLNMLSNGINRRLENPVHIMTAGAPPPPAVLLRTESLGFVVSHGYGLTETGGLVICCTWKNKWNQFPAAEKARLKSRQGVRTPGMAEVDVIDPQTGESVKRDGKSLGEIVLRGGCVMLGYLKDPEGTSKCMKNGWFYTGDVGVMHPDGYLEIKDRSKDVIISGGENLSSVEVESVLYTHPAVNEAAVVARPDEFWGETPCAFVSLKEGVKEKPTEKEVIEFCRTKLPRFMVPKTVVFKEELPKTSTGKIQKFVLRETAKAMGSSKMSRL